MLRQKYLDIIETLKKRDDDDDDDVYEDRIYCCAVHVLNTVRPVRQTLGIV